MDGMQNEDPVKTNTVDSVNELKQICKDKWNAIKANNEDINNTVSPKCLEETSGLITILQEKEKRVQSEINVLKCSLPNVLPDNADIHREVLFKDLHKSISQLQEVLTLVRGQEKALTDQVTQEEETAQQLQSVNACLLVKLEGIDEEDDDNVTMPQVMDELDEKIRKAKAMNKTLTKKLVHFVSDHFPLPTAEDIKAGRKKLRSSDSKLSTENLLPFKVVLQELMNKCIDEPHDPYVIVTNRFWQPYIELLLRCQIVLRHPEDDQRIKLVPFHL